MELFNKSLEEEKKAVKDEIKELMRFSFGGTDYSNKEDWELFGFKSPQEYHDYLFFQSYGNDEEYDNSKNEFSDGE